MTEPQTYVYTRAARDAETEWQSTREDLAGRLRVAANALDDSDITPGRVAVLASAVSMIAHELDQSVDACRLAEAYRP